MPGVTRFGISMDEELSARFDELIRQKGYRNRSEAIRDLVRDALVQQEWSTSAEEVIGTVTLVYNHHKHELADRLTDVQHEHYQQVISSMHIHLDHDNCLEVLAVRGKASEMRKIADLLISQKGVKHGKLVSTSSGREIV